jgi:hypothetical protein
MTVGKEFTLMNEISVLSSANNFYHGSLKKTDVGAFSKTPRKVKTQT